MVICFRKSGNAMLLNYRVKRQPLEGIAHKKSG